MTYRYTIRHEDMVDGVRRVVSGIIEAPDGDITHLFLREHTLADAERIASLAPGQWCQIGAWRVENVEASPAESKVGPLNLESEVAALLHTWDNFDTSGPDPLDKHIDRLRALLAKVP